MRRRRSMIWVSFEKTLKRIFYLCYTVIKSIQIKIGDSKPALYEILSHSLITQRRKICASFVPQLPHAHATLWANQCLIIVSFAQWHYRSQWGSSEARLLLIENFSQYPARRLEVQSALQFLTVHAWTLQQHKKISKNLSHTWSENCFVLAVDVALFWGFGATFR